MTRVAHRQSNTNKARPPGCSSVHSYAWETAGWKVNNACNRRIHNALIAHPISEPVPAEGREEGLGRGFSGGERVWKFTGGVAQMGQSGKTVIEQVMLSNKTLYASSFFVANDHSYTKHFFAGAERICSKIGGGLELAPVDPMETTVEELHEDYERMRHDLYNLLHRFANCNPEPYVTAYIDMEPYLGGIQEWLNRHEPEENRFFYHPDHLGSSSFITDAAGEGYQHLQYMPFGETSVSQKISWWSTPYQFTGKEKDDETGYNYFGARYYNSDLSVWLSVDPLASIYTSITPFAYCLNNPVNFFDPDGRWVKGAGLFRNLLHSDQRNKARMEANKHPGGNYSKKEDGSWVAYWPFTDNDYIDEGNGAKKLVGYAFSIFSKTGNKNNHGNLIMLKHTNHWLGLSTSLLGGQLGFGYTLYSFNSLQQTSNSFNLGLNYSNEISKTSKIIKGLKIGGYMTSGVNVYLSFNQWQSGEIDGCKFAADAFMAGYSHIPVIGWFGGLLYYSIDSFYPGGIYGFGKDYSNQQMEFHNSVGFSMTTLMR